MLLENYSEWVCDDEKGKLRNDKNGSNYTQINVALWMVEDVQHAQTTFEWKS